ncbi:hypothetical protein OM427_08610 [Halomonas sp. 18H]|nr:hypothetical protein [Halomonas sp. 18H]MCW4149589.1 hypothetical protein [Halomonas sp. 18H]
MISNGNGKWMRRGGRFALVLSVLPLVGMPTLQAATSNFSGFSSARQLSDGELGALRGRYVDQGKLMYFGIQMNTEWLTSAGDYINAGAELKGNLTGSSPGVSFEPRLTMVEAVDSDVDMSGSDARIVDAGTGNARGVVQTIQAGGNYNAASNDMTVDILGASDFSGLSASGGESIERQLASGMRVAVGQGGRGPGLDVNLPGVGNVQQRIMPGQGLRQTIQLSSNDQSVRNITRLQLYMDRQAARTGSVGMRQAVESLRALNR